MSSGGEYEFFEGKLFARFCLQPFSLWVDGCDFCVAPEVNAVLTVEVRLADQDRLFRVFSRKKALGKRRTFIGRSVIGGDNGEISGFAAVVDVLFSKITGDHAAAQDNMLIAGHVVMVLRCNG